MKWHVLHPRVPLVVPFWSLREALTIAWLGVTARIIRGNAIARLERQLSDFFGGHFCIGVDSGSTAIALALQGIGCSNGDEVILPSYCCQNVLSAVLTVGCKPVFADIGEDLNIDPSSVSACITSRTRAIIVPHLFGSAAPVDVVEGICRRHGIALIDDAAQAFGTSLHGRLLGTFGDVGIGSFGPGKSITATGGGFLLTNRADLIERIRGIPLAREPYFDKLRQSLRFLFLRRLRRYTIGCVAIVQRFCRVKKLPCHPTRRPAAMITNVDAAIASIQFGKLQCSTHLRQQHATLLYERLKDCKWLSFVPCSLASARTKCAAIFNDNTPTVNPIHFQRWMRARGIELCPPYKPLHQLQEMAAFNRGGLSRTEDLANRVVFLPNDPLMSQSDVNFVAKCCSLYFHESTFKPTG